MNDDPIRQIYLGDVPNWKAIGGLDARITVVNAIGFNPWRCPPQR
jgi:ABC-type phosphate transport system substrate-binding protein